MLETLQLAILAIILHIHVFYIMGNLLKDNSIMSGAWGLGFVVIIIFTAFPFGDLTPRQQVFNIFISIWGIRLALFLFYRKFSLKNGEDFRYVKMRKSWEDKPWLGSYFAIYLPQGIIMFLVAIPIVIVNASLDSPKLNLLDYIALILGIIGLIIEIIADLQLHTFRKNKQTNYEFIQTGLWSKSRHPNYFGEILIWWGIGLLAFSINPIALFSSLLVTIMLRYVSGVNLLEVKYEEFAGYKEYKENTRALLLLP